MKSFETYLSKYLLSFLGVIFFLVLMDLLAFVLVFSPMVHQSYEAASPSVLLEKTAAELSEGEVSFRTLETLEKNQIWAMQIDSSGNCRWSRFLPEEIPLHYTLEDIARFTRGFLKEYPVFVRVIPEGILVLGYPPNSFLKLTTNYFPMEVVRLLPLFSAGILLVDLLGLLGAYCFSRRSILKNIKPLILAIEALSAGEAVDLSIQGELSGLAKSIMQASGILSRQNEARAGWIRGVSHDIRTPLSMILGYAQRIASSPDDKDQVFEQARIIQNQSLRIKQLVEDLNLVSRLEYEMQPLQKKEVRLSRILRTCAAFWLNDGLEEGWTLSLDISRQAESVVMECDERLLERALNNLIQNSIRHNPQGCHIRLCLWSEPSSVFLAVEDDGIGFSDEKREEFLKTPHYLESFDEHLSLRHGLGLRLVGQIVKVHHGSMEIMSKHSGGARIVWMFPLLPDPSQSSQKHSA